MRIAIDARFYGTENTGLGRYTKNVLTNFFDPHDPNDYIVFVTPKYQGLVFPGSVQVVPLVLPHYTAQEQFVMPYLLYKYHVDLLYTLHFNAPIFSPVPTVVTIHDLIKTHFADIATSTHGRLLFTLKRLGYRLVMSQVIRRAKKIITPSQAVKNDILLVYPRTNAEKIFPIYEAVDDFFGKAKPVTKQAASTRNLLFVGNSYPHKNLRGLLAAFTLLCKEGSYKLKLLTKLTPYLRSILKELSPDVSKHLTIKEGVSDESLSTAYQAADVLVTPSFMEGFGLPALEALSVGTRVVASKIPVYQEIYGDNVTYCNPFDEHSIAGAIKQSLKTSPKPYRYPRTWAQVGSDIRKVLL